MICKRCKQEIPDDAVLCRHCGEIIEENMEKKVKEKEQEIQTMEEDEKEELSIEDLLREPLPTEFKVTEKVPYRQSEQYRERKKQVRRTLVMTAGMLAATVAVGVGTFFLVKEVILKPNDPDQVVKIDPVASSENNQNTATPADGSVVAKNDTEKESETKKETEKETKKETEKQTQRETKTQTEKETETEAVSERVGSVSIQASAKGRAGTEEVAPVTIKRERTTEETSPEQTEERQTELRTEQTETQVPGDGQERQTDPPQTDPPQTDPPQTDPPQTDPPQTDPPQTDPPQTDPPQTEPPQTDPPQTEPDDGYQDGWGEEEEPIYSGGGYILPNSSSELLSRDSLVGMTASDLMLARNEIFARHGRMFEDEWLQSYFDSQSWYQGIYSPSEFSYDLLSSIEVQNINTILAYEVELGA